MEEDLVGDVDVLEEAVYDGVLGDEAPDVRCSLERQLQYRFGAVVNELESLPLTVL